jgi:hypothetical protein
MKFAIAADGVAKRPPKIVLQALTFGCFFGFRVIQCQEPWRNRADHHGIRTLGMRH